MTDSIVTITGEYHFQDYLAAHRLNRHGLQVALRLASIAIGCMLVLFGLGILGSKNLSNVALGTFFVVWGIYLSDLVFKLQIKRHWGQYPALRNRSLEMSLSNKGISNMDDEGNPAVSKWENFTKWKESDATFLLYVSPRLWVSIPKRLLQPGDDEIIRQMLDRHISQAT